MWRISRRDLVAARGRLSLTVLAVALGVAFIVAAGVVGASLQASLGGINEAFTRNTDAVVEGVSDIDDPFLATTPAVPVEAVTAIEQLGAVAGVATDVIVSVEATTPDGASLDIGETVSAGVSVWPTDQELNAFDLAEGTAPAAAGDIVLDRATARQAGLVLGDEVVLTSAATELRGRLVGLATIDGNDGFGGAPLPSVGFADAQQLAGRPGADLLRVRGDGSQSQAELVSSIEAALPAGFEARTGEELAEEVAAEVGQLIGIIRNVLIGFAVVALLVGAFLVANTFAMVIAQRQRQLALLRAVGATVGQVRRAVLVEAFAVSLVSSLLGVAAGLGVGWLLLQALDAVGFGLPVYGLRLDPTTVVLGIVLGTVVGVLSALRAIRSATRVPPVAALRAAGLATTARRTSIVRLVAGPVLLALAIALFVLPAPEGVPGPVLPAFGALLAVVAVIVVNPLIAQVAAPALLAVLPGGGAVPTLARRNTARNPGRVAGTSSALLIGVVVVVGSSTVAESVAVSLGGSVDRSLSSTAVVVTSSGAQVGESTPAQLAALPEVAAVATATNGIVALNDELQPVTLVSPGFDALADVTVVDGVGPGALAVDQVALLVDRADELGVGVGDELRLGLSDGSELVVAVAGTYRSGILLGGLTMTDAALRTTGTLAPGFSLVFASAASGVSDEAALDAVAGSLGAGQGDALSVAEFSNTLRSAVDQLIAIITVLLGITLVIALIGIVNTTILSTLERTRELGMLRAIGTTRGQLRSVVRRETVAITLYGTLVGVVAGLVIALGYLATLADDGVSTISVPWGQVVTVVLLALLAGVLAAYFPARRASRLNVLDALRAE